MSRRLSITFYNTMQELAHAIEVVNLFLDPLLLSERRKYAANLVLEEVLTNIVRYGYEDDGFHEIVVALRIDNEEIALTIEDDGRPFNPLTVQPPDRSKSAMDLIEEGMGIQFVRHMMDAMEYRRESGKNQLQVWLFL